MVGMEPRPYHKTTPSSPAPTTPTARRPRYGNKRRQLTRQITSSWTPINNMSNEQLAITTGRNTALAEIFETLAKRRFELADERIDRQQTQFEHDLRMERDAALNTYTMNQIEYRAKLRGNTAVEEAKEKNETPSEEEDEEGKSRFDRFRDLLGTKINFFQGDSTAGNIADNVLNAATMPARLTAGALSMTPGVEQAVDSKAGGAVLGAAGDVGSWTLDKISRPIQSGAASIDYFADTDKTPGKTTTSSDFFNKYLSKLGYVAAPIPAAMQGLTGVNALEIFGEHVSDEGVKGALTPLKAARKGFWAGLTDKDALTYGELVARQAERNPRKTIHDSKDFQAAAGLTLDIALDPINFVGVGVVAAPVRATKAAVESKRLVSFSKELEGTGLVRDADGVKLSADTIYDLLGGNFKPATAAERAEGTRIFQNNYEVMKSQVGDTKGVKKFANKKIRQLERVNERMRIQQEQILSELESESLLSAVRHEVEAAVQTGDLPSASLNVVDDSVDTLKVIDAINADRVKNAKQERYINIGNDMWRDRINNTTTKMPSEEAAAKNLAHRESLPSFHDVMGEGWKNDYRFKDAPSLSAQQHIFDESDRVASHYFPEYSGLKKASIDLWNGIRREESFVRNTTGDARKAHEATLKKMRARKDHIDARKDEMRALTIKKMVATQFDAGTGDFALQNADEVNRLLEVRTKAEEALSAPSQSYTGVAVEGHRTNLDESGKLIDEGQNQYDMDLNSPELFDPDGRFFDSHQQMEAIRKKANKRLSELKYPDYTKADKELIEAPPRFLNKDGSLKTDKIFSRETFEFENGSFKLISGKFEGEEYKYLKKIEHKLNAKLEERTHKWETSEKRRRDDEAQLEAERVQAGDIPSRPDKSRLTKDELNTLESMSAHEGAASYIPVVKIGDDTYRWDSSPGGMKDFPHSKADQQFSDRMNRILTRNAHVPPRFKDILRDSNIPFPEHPELFAKWAEDNMDVLRSAIEPGKIGFLRRFKAAHDEQALNDFWMLRDKLYGRTTTRNVREARRGFAFQSPRSLLYMATRSKQSMKSVLTSGAMHYPVKGVKHPGKAPAKVDPPVKGVSSAKDIAAYRKYKEWEVAENKWLDAVWDEFVQNPTKAVEKFLRRGREQMINKRKADSEYVVTRATKETTISPAERTKYKNSIRNEVVADLKSDMASAGGLTGITDDGAVRFRNMNSIKRESESANSQEYRHLKSLLDDSQKAELDANRQEQLRQARNLRRRQAYAQKKAQAKDERSLLEVQDQREAIANAKLKVQALQEQRMALKKQHALEQEKLKKAQKEAKATRKEFKKRLDEEFIIRVLNAESATNSRALSLMVLGEDFFNLPGSQQMFALTDAISGLPVIKQMRQAFADAFKNSSKLPVEMQLMRARAMAHSPNIIAGHVNRYKERFGHVPLNDRKDAFFSVVNRTPKGTSSETREAIREEFQPILDWVNGKNTIAGQEVTIGELNRWLPRELQIPEKLSPDVDLPTFVKDLVDANHRKLKTKKESIIRGKTEKTKDLYDDPVQMLWHLRVGLEQALNQKALVHSMKETFGISLSPKHTKFKKKLEANDWFEHDGVLYPGEIWKPYTELLKMFEPANITAFGQLADSVVGTWKAGVTVYNPGYYTRNAIGEIMSSWFAGVKDPRRYKDSFRQIRYMMSDGKEVEALKEQFPALSGVSSDSVKGSEIALTRNATGETITREDLHILYHEYGLKSGFINTEFGSHFERTGELVKHGISRSLTEKHEKLRNFGEYYEDYFRMAHFIDAIKKAPKSKSIRQAAEDAAQEVRKYHFDYTDFTNFEKTVMLRAFPFYKWSRKALPLMMSMLFMKPGKVMVYPKVMHAAEMRNLSTEDIMAADDEGFMPRYEGIVPKWIEDLWAYEIGTDQEENDTYFNMATPQMDIFKQLADPLGSAHTLANPLIKYPAEQLLGQTLSPDMPMELKGAEDRASHIASSTPGSQFMTKILKGIWGDKEDALVEKGGKMDETLLSFLTGLGFYENNPNRQQGEMGRREEGFFK